MIMIETILLNNEQYFLQHLLIRVDVSACYGTN